MADEIIKVTMSGTLGVIRFCDGASEAVSRGLTDGLVKAGTTLKSAMSGTLASGQPLGRRSGKAAGSVVAKVAKQKRKDYKALMVFPSEFYAWINAYGFSRDFIQVGGRRQARNINSGAVRDLERRRRARKFEETVYAGGYRRVHHLTPRPYALVVMNQQGETVNADIKKSVDFALRWWGNHVPRS